MRRRRWFVLFIVVGGILSSCGHHSSRAGSASATGAVPQHPTSSQLWLYFRPVYCYFPDFSASTTTMPAPTSAVVAPVSQSTCFTANAARIKSTLAAGDYPNGNVLLPSRGNTIRYVLGPADMSGSAIHHAVAIVDTSTGQYQVQVTFTNAGGAKFDQIAAQRYACYQQSPSDPPPCALEAVDWDGLVLSAPAIEASSFNGTAVISGSTSNPFTKNQAETLARQINLLAGGSH
jgi:preprotein translocase subunit SecD